MSGPVVVFGASGHGKVVCEILTASGVVVLGFVDDEPSRTGTTLLGLPVLGTSAWLEGKQAEVALGVGDNLARERVVERIIRAGGTLRTAIHPHASVSPSAIVGDGTAVMARAVINADASLGRAVIVNTAAVIEHDVVVGDFAHVSPNATMGGGARLGRSSQLGIGGTMLPRVCVGDMTIVGGGAVVPRDLPANVIAMGVPARVTRPRPHP